MKVKMGKKAKPRQKAQVEMPLPFIRPPPLDKFRDTLWFVGLDPATKVDYFGVTIHGLNPRPEDGSPWLPFLRGTWQIRYKRYTDIINWLRHELFESYPPSHGILDATNDIMVAQEMTKVFGETMIRAQAMNNTLNYQLKQTGWRYLEDGYRFPNTAAMKDKEMAVTIRTLKKECLEQHMVRTPEGKKKFMHPPNRHDDLNRSWEMSLLAVYEFQTGTIGVTDDDYRDDSQEELRDSRLPSLVDAGLPGGSWTLPYRADPLETL